MTLCRILRRTSSNVKKQLRTFLNDRRYLIHKLTVSATPGRGDFFAQQKEKREVRKKERVSKQKLLQGCHQGQKNVTALAILERLEFKNIYCRSTMVADRYYSVFHGPCTLKSISPALTQFTPNIYTRAQERTQILHFDLERIALEKLQTSVKITIASIFSINFKAFVF